MFFTALAALIAVCPAARAQPSPHLGYVYPAGGQQGTVFQVKVGGRFLDGVNRAHVSGAGIRATVGEHVKPVTLLEATDLQQQLRSLQTGQPSTGTMRQIAEVRKRLLTFDRNIHPAIAETVTLQVTMARDAEPGDRELRLGTPAGWSNPLVFCVGQLREVLKQASRTSDDPRAFQQFQMTDELRHGATEMNLTVPAMVNGQILAGGVDRYRFPARAGQSLVVAVRARQLIPFLPDAVPGWFQATLGLLTADGKELAYADDFRFHPDPVLHVTIPKDGEYVVEIKDALYRGRDDFVYRLALGELPFVTSLFPLGGPAHARISIQLNGWNLLTTNLTLEPKEPLPTTLALSVPKGPLVRVPFALDTLPERLEQEPNDQPALAQSVPLPLIINGRIAPPGDRDVFRFEGRAGDEFVAEVRARRLDSPLDSALKLTDASGRQLAFNDDHPDRAAGLHTHHADSYLHAFLPEGGTYFLDLHDTQRQGGDEYAYRLRLGPPQPDFELRVVPSNLNARGGSNVVLTVYALRRDGFSNEIALALSDAPAGFSLSEPRLPANQDQVRLVLTVPPTPISEPISLRVEGRAWIRGQEVIHPAVPADEVMQAFAYRHLVPAQELLVSVTGPFPSTNKTELPSGAIRVSR